MLVLTRKLDEQILIGNDIKITLVRVRGNSVRIGIEAPRDVRVVRGELLLHDQAGETRMSDASKTDEPSCEELQLSEREQAFAHPVATPSMGHSHAGNVSKSTKSARKSGGETPRRDQFAPTSSPNVEKIAAHKLFVGSVRRDGQSAQLQRAELRHAPLARFMPAQ